MRSEMLRFVDIKGGFHNVFANSTSRKWVLIGAGTILGASVASYYLCRRSQRSTASSDIPIDPDHSAKIASLGSVSSSDKSETVTMTQESPASKVINLKEQGNKNFRNGNFDLAAEYYSSAIKGCPTDLKNDLAILYQNRGASYEKLGDLNNAYIDCTLALEMNPVYIKALSRRGKILEQQDKLNEAAHDFLKCCILENFSNEESMKKVNKCLKETSHRAAKKYISERRDKHERVPLSRTIVKSTLRAFCCDPVLSGILSRDSKDIMITGSTLDCSDNYRLVVEAIQSYRYDVIQEICTREVEASSDSNIPILSSRFAECLLIRAFFLTLAGAFIEAKQDLELLIERINMERAKLDSDQLKHLLSSTYLIFGFFAHLVGTVEESIDYMNKAQEIWPDNSDVYCLRGQIRAMSQTEGHLSISDIEKAAQLQPNYLHYQIQALAFQLKLASENPMLISNIMDKVRDLIKKHPKDAELHMFYAQIFIDLEQINLAVEQLDMAIKLDPNAADIFAQRAFVDMICERNDAAIVGLKKALELDPFCLPALEIMAQFHSRRSDVTKMNECYEKALKIARSEMEVEHFLNMRETTLLNIQIAEELLVQSRSS